MKLWRIVYFTPCTDSGVTVIWGATKESALRCDQKYKSRKYTSEPEEVEVPTESPEAMAEWLTEEDQ